MGVWVGLCFGSMLWYLSNGDYSKSLGTELSQNSDRLLEVLPVVKGAKETSPFGFIWLGGTI